MPMTSENLRWMINAIPDAAILISRDRTIINANQKAADIFLTSVTRLEGDSLDILIPEHSRTAHEQHVEGFFSEPMKRPMGSGLRFHGSRADGSIFPVAVMLSQIMVESTDYAIAIIRDDSDRAAIQAMKEKLESANLRLAKAQEVGGLAWWEADLRTNELVWSAVIPRILDLGQADHPSFCTIRNRCIPEDRQNFDAIHGRWGTVSGKTATYRIRKKDGKIRWIEETVHQEMDHIVLGVMRDITDQKNLEKKLRTESVTDELTGLFNRKQFNRDLKSRYSEFVRSGTNSSIITYDFDYFKNINDLYGHAMGDQVLSQSATIVTDQLRASDHAYRLGGEEFAILLRGTDMENARVLAERIRKSVGEARFRLDDAWACTTVSLGVSQLHRSDSCFEDVSIRADEALYRSKANGRNKVSICE
ncbi:PAS domain S-box-containing protein/diguanylate cyclase (GGDEF) domain-containing protein [Marinobacter antarcticus]|uniref:diguanylate cyclase n=1 Tax=Marinobacter antarcticus TaxID=564117 RepID=A0A1M6PC24_9GAMM|nr:sensor domain-containing diguanylate cyclase [Marinobacter antarcticus]SHK05511.1 PAS domain S-box-containing protein/diguanylate cyclase (GGDEF) domain-containing protein [Marinobacter antarcticus]